MAAPATICLVLMARPLSRDLRGSELIPRASTRVLDGWRRPARLSGSTRADDTTDIAHER